MINFEKFVLDNGLKVIVHQDKSTPIVAFNLLYDVGARDENPSRTGFAHLFEHLMFGGSVNISNYDEVVEKSAGQNNAFTTNDITNYYITLPKDNLEQAFRLESDRMLGLAFTHKSLEVQRNVVVEEFKQNYPGVVHLDGTSRLQVVNQEPHITLLKVWKDITKCPVLLNTSLNVKGQPIVDSPEDAIKTFLSTNIDVLVIGDFIVKKKDEKI